jgi:oligoendopeptidase F
VNHQVTIRKNLILAGLWLAIMAIPSLQAQEAGKVPTRDEVEQQNTWDLTNIYESDEAWEAGFQKSEGMLQEFGSYEGQLGNSAQNLLDGLQLQDEAGTLMGLLYTYAGKKNHQDIGNTVYQAMFQRIQGLNTKLSQASSFIEPEILAIPEKKLNKFIQKEKGLNLYDHYLDDLTRVRAHILEPDQEQLLALAGDVTGGASNAFGMLTNADFKWGTIKDEDGQEVQMSRGRYGLYMNSPDRRVRHDAYKALYVPFEAHVNALTSLFVTQMKRDIFYAQARQYENSLEAALNGPNIPVSVYHNLIGTVNDNLAPLQRWAGIKKRVLGVEELHPYDTYAPLFSEVDKQYSFDEAKLMILEALKPMGEKVSGIVQLAFDERWIDIYENIGKRTGAYSWAAYGAHPHILMNYNGTLDNVFTLAHELGHVVHSYLSMENQPYIDYSYPPMLAEVASTTFEGLLRDYLLDRADSDEEALALLQEYVESIGSTFYRQTRFAEFELKVHEMVEQDEPLTHEVLNQVFGDMYRKYWGPEMVVDGEEDLSWSRIPHFYRTYYVYTYATSFAASQMVSKRIKEEGQPAVDDLLKYLSSGGSEYPIATLKIAGVDMSTPAPVQATTAKMDELLDQMEAILAGK